MLLLSRKCEQEVVISVPEGFSGEVIVRVAELRGDKARLGFTADASIGIDRREVYEAKKREKQDGEKQSERIEEDAARSAS